MTNPDEAVERVLTGLREVDSPQGMERRILDAVQMRSAERSRWRSVLPSALIATRPWPLVAAGIVVVSLAASIALHRRHRDEHEVANTYARRSPHTPGALDVRSALRAEAAGTTRPSPERAVLRSRIENNPAKTEVISEAIDDENALAMSEMLAPSKPPPPLPLTHQERLLAEVVHHGAPEELDNLKPDVRAKQIEIAKAEFQDFFEPPSLNPSPVKTTNKADQVQN